MDHTAAPQTKGLRVRAVKDLGLDCLIIPSHDLLLIDADLSAEQASAYREQIRSAVRGALQSPR